MQMLHGQYPHVLKLRAMRGTYIGAGVSLCAKPGCHYALLTTGGIKQKILVFVILRF